ncbi:LPS translocon maturation chaperone LptM [Marinobacter orientalis]|uniref:Lipoprotein n=1 Tax=Marinobacter orientalis TaxID=1928859 RepID=A0A7Y0WRS8_9GAMM|nr:lipoprotein [Marinobacter orientalis]NMT63250.1 lipoprotein [Marinobacter orientalis]TGX51901.1 hypothetical protein DIT72_07775 [Marinobacter orientalis]
MKPGQTIVFMLVMVGFIAGCGQKGPLYREIPPDDDRASEQASDSEQGRNEDAGDR